MKEIRSGQKFLCICDVIDKEGFVFYTAEKIYISENYNCITDNNGSREHRWNINTPWIMKKFKKHFIRIPQNKRYNEKRLLRKAGS